MDIVVLLCPGYDIYLGHKISILGIPPKMSGKKNWKLPLNHRLESRDVLFWEGEYLFGNTLLQITQKNDPIGPSSLKYLPSIILKPSSKILKDEHIRSLVALNPPLSDFLISRPG
jgi:hypothetical protein